MHHPIRRAFTLLEVLIASIVLAIVIVLAMLLFQNTDQTVGESMAIADATMRSNELEKLLSRELGDCYFYETADAPPASPLGGTALSPNGRFTSVSFAPVDITPGFNPLTGKATLDPVRQIRFQYDPGEGGAGSGNDADDDNDGLIDEGFIELLEDTNGDDVADTRIAILAKDISSEEEDYPTVGPDGKPINSDGKRGVDWSIEFTPTPPSNADPDNLEGISINFAIVRRLPKKGAVYEEDRTLRMAFRNQ